MVMGSGFGGEQENELERPLLATSLLDEDDPSSEQVVEKPESIKELCEDFIDDLFRLALLPVVKSTTFIQEIEARKWVYHGLYMEQYPRIYHTNLVDEFYL